MAHWADGLEEVGACEDAVKWCRSYESLEAAWAACGRAEWMLWLAARAGAGDVDLTRCACEIARAVLHLVPAGERRPLAAIEAAERWCEDPSPASSATAQAAAQASVAAARASVAAAQASVWPAALAASVASRAASAASRAAAASAGPASAAWAAMATASEAEAAAPGAAPEHADIVRRHFDCPALEV